jgi:hypothetical protein
VVDQLRLFWNRPLRDGDRPRLFAVAVAVIAAAAGVFALLDRAIPAPPPADGSRQPVAPAATMAGAAPQLPAATVDAQAPSEEGQPTAAAYASTGDIASAKRAARTFLAGYLAYTYGHQRAADLGGASAAVRHQLATRPPRVPARERHRHPRVVTVTSNGVSPDHAEIAALVDDGHRRYTITLELARRGHRWLITSVGG